MKLIKYPSKEQWAELLKRPALNTESLFDTVRSIIDKVKVIKPCWSMKPLLIKLPCLPLL